MRCASVGAELALEPETLADDPVEDALVRLATRRRDPALLPPAPNSCSNATRGSRIIGSGSVGRAQLIVSV